jgi:hypothetical protein
MRESVMAMERMRSASEVPWVGKHEGVPTCGLVGVFGGVGVAAGGSSGSGPEGEISMICWKLGRGGSPMRVTVGTGAADEDEDGDGDVEVGRPVVVTSGFWLG